MKNILSLIIVSIVLAGCSKDPECNYDECYEVATAADVQNLEAYLQSNNIAATKHCSGMYYAIDQQGSGTRPDACNTVSVAYRGQFTNGSVFDSTKTNQPASFGLDRVITGFRNGLMQLKPGAKARLYIPPSIGYGSSNYNGIPGNSILIFTVELKDVQ